ncbi:MAG: hypothetical protein PVJ17_14820, partial [Lysobacterales bacterium]
MVKHRTKWLIYQMVEAIYEPNIELLERARYARATKFVPDKFFEPTALRNSVSRPRLAAKTKKPAPGRFSCFGGEGGIRTHGTENRTLDFESSPFDH